MILSIIIAGFAIATRRKKFSFQKYYYLQTFAKIPTFILFMEFMIAFFATTFFILFILIVVLCNKSLRQFPYAFTGFINKLYEMMAALSSSVKIKTILQILAITAIVNVSVLQALSQTPNWKNIKVLVYTKNGKGYVHDNIPYAVKCIQKLGLENGFKVDVSDTPIVFTGNNLKQYTLLIFPSTNNDVFDTDEQRLVFRRYIQSGGGFVGLHSVTGTERNWKWFKMMVGGSFSWHARNQKFNVKVIEPGHPSMQGIPKTWERKDECYFAKELYPGTKVLMAHDITSLDHNTVDSVKIKQFSAPFAELYPAVWYHHFDGGNIWITALGHDKENYTEPMYIKHIFQGITFVANHTKKMDVTKAYADSRDTPVRF